MIPKGPRRVAPSAITATGAGVAATAPTPITRDGARGEARRELSREIYRSQRPGLVDRAFTWTVDRVESGWHRLSSVTPGGRLGVLGVILLVVALAVAARFWLGPPRRGTRPPGVSDLLGQTTLTAKELRAEAEQLAGRGAWADAVRSRMRAAVRALEERGLSEPRPGRTLGEVNAEVAANAPGAAQAFERAADVFADVWYGGAPADERAYQIVAAADGALAGAAAGRSSWAAVPS
jgi:hypothetical protein